MLLHFALAITIIGIIGAAPAVHRLPEIRYADLVTRDPETAQNLANHFTQLGAAQITGIPRFGMTRKRALEDLADCLVEEKNAPSIMMADGSKRISTGAASHNGVADKMSNICGDASDRLRATVNTVMTLVFQMMDSKLSGLKRNILMQPSYDSFTELVSRGEHLEHLHAYYSPDSSDKAQASRAATLDYHVDAGMMIAMTTGFYSNAEPSAQSGLYIKLSDGSRVKAEMEEDALIVMMGEGAAKWLSPVFGQPFRALPHALVADLPVGSAASRSWYGKMYLPPADAVIPETQGMTFKQYHQVESKKSSMLNQVTQHTDQSLLQQLLPAACGGEVGRRYLLTVSESCSSNQIWCWAQCMDVGELRCGSDAVCWDSHENVISNGDNHCMASGVPGGYCYPICPNATLGNNSYSGYCYGEGTSMFMQGFVSIVSEGSGNTECVNLLFQEWTLDSRLKFGFACFGVFLMGILIQFLTKFRASRLNIVVDRCFPAGNGYLPLLKRVVNTGLFGLQITLSYFAMLVAMTYSVELFCMVCAGLTVGYGIFHSENSKGQMSDPCCPEPPLEEETDKSDASSLLEGNRMTSSSTSDQVTDASLCCTPVDTA
jgi:hypothetical protein